MTYSAIDQFIKQKFEEADKDLSGKKERIITSLIRRTICCLPKMTPPWSSPASGPEEGENMEERKVLENDPHPARP